MSDPEPVNPRHDDALRRSESCRYKCFAIVCENVGDVSENFGIESQLERILPLNQNLRNCMRSGVVRGAIKIREALRGEIYCSIEQVAVCFGRQLLEILAPVVLKRSSNQRELAASLRRIKIAIGDQVKDVYLEAHDELIVRPGTKVVTHALSWGSSHWRLKFLREIDARSSDITPPPSTNGVSAEPKNGRKMTHPPSAVRGRSIVSMPAAARTRRFIERRDMTITDFANQVGTTGRTMSRFLSTGKVTKSIFDQIAAFQGTSRAELLADDAAEDAAG